MLTTYQALTAILIGKVLELKWLFTEGGG